MSGGSAADRRGQAALNGRFLSVFCVHVELAPERGGVGGAAERRPAVADDRIGGAAGGGLAVTQTLLVAEADTAGLTDWIGPGNGSPGRTYGTDHQNGPPEWNV